MDTSGIKEKEESYVQRLRTRRRDEDDDAYSSKTFRRRISIINSISEQSPENFRSTGNPFEMEFGSLPRKSSLSSSLDKRQRRKSSIEQHQTQHDQQQQQPFHNRSTLEVTLRRKKRTSPQKSESPAYSRPSAPVQANPETRRSSQQLYAKTLFGTYSSRESLPASLQRMNAFYGSGQLMPMMEKQSQSRRSSLSVVERRGPDEPRDSLFSPKRRSPPVPPSIVPAIKSSDDDDENKENVDVSKQQQQRRKSRGAMNQSDSTTRKQQPDLVVNPMDESTTNIGDKSQPDLLLPPPLQPVFEESNASSSDMRRFCDSMLSGTDFVPSLRRRPRGGHVEGLVDSFNSQALSNASFSTEPPGNLSPKPPAHQRQQQRELYRRSVEVATTSDPKSPNSPRTRMSIVSNGSFTEYFADPTNKKIVNQQTYIKEDLEEEFARGNAELQRQGPDQFFHNRVLEALEPFVIEPVKPEPIEATRCPPPVPPKTSKLEQLQGSERRFGNLSAHASTTSLASEDMRSLEREIEMLDMDDEEVEEAMEATTETTSSRKSSESKESGQQQGEREEKLQQKDLECVTPSRMLPRDGTMFYDALKSPAPATPGARPKPADLREIYGTPMPITSAQLEAIKRRHTDGVPSRASGTLRRSLSNFFNSLTRRGKLRHRQPCHESTRNLGSDEWDSKRPLPPAPSANEPSPILSSHFSSTISTIMPNTPSTCDEALIATNKRSPGSALNNSGNGNKNNNNNVKNNNVFGNSNNNNNNNNNNNVVVNKNNNSGNYNNVPNGDDKLETTIPEEVKNFLYDALGTEHYATLNTYADRSDLGKIYSTIGEVKSDYQTPCAKNNNNNTTIENIDSSNNASALVSDLYAPVNNGQEKPSRSRPLSRFKNLSQRIKKKIRKSFRHDDDDRAAQLETQIEVSEVSPSLHEKVQSLRAQVEIQQTLICQASKALALCCAMPEFTTSLERVESERALLLARLRNQAHLDEIVRLTTRGRSSALGTQWTAYSELELEEISLRLREDVLRRERHGDELAEWFVVVVSEGQRVWASRAVLCSSSTPRLHFPDRLVVTELAPDFKLSLRVYSLKLRQQINYDHDERYHLPGYNDLAGVNCPSPNNLLRNSLMRRSQRSSTMTALSYQHARQHHHHQEVNISAATKNSSFVECGSLELTLQDIQVLPPWNLKAVPTTSILYGTMDARTECNLQLLVSMEGFVNLGEEVKGRVYYTKYYCVIDEQLLHFWRYPGDRELGKPADRTIDLCHCATRRIEVADRSLCPRPRTLLISTARKRDALDVDTSFTRCKGSSTIVRRLLSFDEKHEMEEWREKLNYVVSALREWNSIVEF